LPQNVLAAQSEPTEIAKIFGNFTKEEIQDLGVPGYKLAVGIGHGGDYNGYTVSFREYENRDSYRKALTSYGPHTADYMVTRLVNMAAALQGGPPVAADVLDPAAQADEGRQEAFAAALGQASSAAYDGYAATLPDDMGPAAASAQPTNVTRFQAATFSWVGGSNALDNPTVVVQRRQSDGSWAVAADQQGEVETFLALPSGFQSVATYRAGQQQWKWTANFEAFDPFPAGAGRQVTNGVYR